MKGMSSYETQDRVHVVMCHYSTMHDPDTPEGREWVAAESMGYPGGIDGTQWRREMEIDFTVRGSSLVFKDWRERSDNVVVDPRTIPDHWIIHFGYDYGYREPFAGLFIAYNGRFEAFVVDEIYEKGLPVTEHARLIKQSPYWERARFKVGDPSIWHKTQHVGHRVTSVGDLLAQQGVHLQKGRKEPGIDVAFRDMLLGTYWKNKEAPKLKIFRTCHNLIRELQRLKFRDYITKVAAERSDMMEEIASKKTHAWDCMKYVMMGHPIVEPDDLPPPEGSLEQVKRQLKALRRKQKYLLQ